MSKPTDIQSHLIQMGMNLGLIDFDDPIQVFSCCVDPFFWFILIPLKSGLYWFSTKNNL